MDEKVLIPRELHGLWDEENNKWVSKPYYRNTKQLVRNLIKDLKRNDIKALLTNNKKLNISKKIKIYCIKEYGKCGTKLFKAAKLTYERYKVPGEDQIIWNQYTNQ